MTTRRATFVLLSLTMSAAAFADDHPMLDRFSMSAGVFANSFSGSTRVDGNVRNSGTRLDFDRDLGQNGTRYLPYVAATWRPFERHEFELSYYHDDTDGSKDLHRTIVFNGQAFDLDTRLKSKFTLDSGSFTYRYWAWIGDQAAFGLTAGLQAYSFDLKLSANVSASGGGGGVSGSVSRSAKASSDLPDPSIGLAYRLQMAPWARLVVDAGAFKANVDNVDATLYNARLGAEFYPFEHWAVIAQYSYNKIDADVDRNKLRGNVTFRFSGGQVLLKYRF